VKGRCHEGKSVTGQRSNQLNYVPTKTLKDLAKTRINIGYCRFCVLCVLCTGRLISRLLPA
jgi:hypothetical protein